MFRGSIVALVTPLNQDGGVDFSALAQLVEFHIEQGTDAIVAMGTTGESATFSLAEHISVVKSVIETAAGRIPVIGGNGANSTLEAIELTQALTEIGVDGMLGVTPYYNKPTQAGLIAHFSAVAKATHLPQILYNVPGRTCCDMSTDTVVELAKIDNIVGLKDATGEIGRVSGLRQRCPQDFILLSGDDQTAMAFMLCGGDGVISVVNNLAAADFKALCSAALAGDITKARALDAKLTPLYETLFIEANPIPVKWCAAEMGLIPNTVIRLPLLPLSQANQPLLAQALNSVGL